MPLIASVTVASFSATDGEIAAIKSSTPTAPIIALVFMSTTSGTDYTAHCPLQYLNESLNPTQLKSLRYPLCMRATSPDGAFEFRILERSGKILA